MRDLRLSFHIPWIAMIIVPQFIMAFYNAGTPWIAINAVSILGWAFYPCRDKNFGLGKRYNWVRQSVFVSGTFIVLGIGYWAA